DGMGAFVAQRLIKLLIAQDRPIKGARIGVLGLTFKENVPDLRNSRVPDILAELRQFGVEALVHDPRADAEEAMHEYGLRLSSFDELTKLDGLVIAVSHREYVEMPKEKLLATLVAGGAIADVKSMLRPSEVPSTLAYWCL
ncbi:partial UDP-N-acetyl-D-glucosamine 6-dehydrogenase, partial [Anaerolineae bacterium]